MSETSEQLDAMFPALDDGQIARLRAFGEERHVEAGEIVFEQGDSSHGVFLVLDGSIEIVTVSKPCRRAAPGSQARGLHW